VITAGIGLHDAGIHRESFTLDQTSRHTGGNNALKYVPKEVTLPEAMQTILREGGMVRDFVIEIEPAEPTVSQVQLDLLGQFAFRA